MTRAFVWFGAAALAIAAPTSALAYCRTSTCGNNTIGATCVPMSASDCGKPIFWPESCVSFSVQRDGGPTVTEAQTESIVKSAFAQWMNADCGGGTHPHILVTDAGKVTCSEIEYNPTGANNNAIIFRANGWPYAATNALALTTVTFNLDTGEIRDADMELNATDATFTTSDTDVEYDLQSIVTHETGHFLGLAHSPNADATMRADYPPKSISLRTLSDDDMAAICATYPPGDAIDADCDATPHGGLGDACHSPMVAQTGCCSVAIGSGAGATTGLAALAALVVGVALQKMRRRRR